jgi:hypothetical protein
LYRSTKAQKAAAAADGAAAAAEAEAAAVGLYKLNPVDP